MKKNDFLSIISHFTCDNTMQLIPLNPKQPLQLPPIALTIGNFDGVHLGHQAMLSALHQDAKKMGLKTAVMVFEPQPREFFSPDNPPARLTSLDEKSAILSALGVDYLLVARFDDEFRLLSAAAFAEILTQMGVRHLVLGDDFRFGHDRLGDKAFLRQVGFSVDSLETVAYDNQRVSSTAIREALAGGDLALAKLLLGRDYAITGEVVHGDKIGRTLAFPTANIALARPKPALHGVFGVDVLAYQNGNPIHLANLAQSNNTGMMGTRPNSLFGAVSIGTRPSVGGADYRLEVHLPKFVGDLYGLTLQVVFLTYLHGEKTYPSFEALKVGIADDVAQLIHYHTSHMVTKN